MLQSAVAVAIQVQRESHKLTTIHVAPSPLVLCVLDVRLYHWTHAFVEAGN
jgi:hypothetical protein